MSPTSSNPAPSPYGSASDLPSFREMKEQIQGLKLLTIAVAREQRTELLKIEQQLDHLADVVDSFYERLGPRNWIFHDLLNVEAVETILDETGTSEEAEQQFIALYRDGDNLSFLVSRLSGVEGLRERFHQIERAKDHYDAGQFDSTALQLIAVMDGFINDFQPDRRQGVAAREPDDMTAWDSVVGHHLGLTNALKAFNKTIKKRVDGEVYELHRHGIVHGSITRFDNVVVATKAWNMLFALVDWAAATTKSHQPEEPEPTFKELLQGMAENAKTRAQLDQWESSRLSAGEADFETHEMYVLTAEFLTAWRERNFGTLARFPSRDLDYQGLSVSQMAGKLRETFEHTNLSDFRVTELENTAPAIWLTRGEATVNGKSGTFECRWVIEETDGSVGYGSDSAKWYLVFCDPLIVWHADE